MTNERLSELEAQLAEYDDGRVVFVDLTGVMGLQELREVIRLARAYRAAQPTLSPADSRLQLIAQARELHTKAMNRSDLADEGAWIATPTVNGWPPNNYWQVTATRTPTKYKDAAAPFTVSKALAKDPSVAALLTFVSTALPQLCDLAESALTPKKVYFEAADMPDAALSTPPVGGLDREAVAEAIHPGSEGRARVVARKAADRVLALATPQWLPIPLTVDTSKAPFDGEFYLLAAPSGYTTTPLRVEVGRWYPEYRPRQPWQTHSNDDYTDGGALPTHYMPLPRGPQ